MNENIAVPLTNTTILDIIPEVTEKSTYNETLWVLEQCVHYSAIGESVYLVRYQRRYDKQDNIRYSFGIVSAGIVERNPEYYNAQDSFK